MMPTAPPKRLKPLLTPLIASSLLAVVMLLCTLPARAQQTSLTLLDCTADLCHADDPSWTLTKSADTSGLVNGSGPVVWTIEVVKTPAFASPSQVNGSITIQNTGAAPAPIGNIVVNLQKPNSQKIGGKLVPWVSVAADVADASSGDAATSANSVAAGSAESPAFNAAFGAGNYTVSGARGTFTETAASGSAPARHKGQYSRQVGRDVLAC
jgi:hypothetical protein